MWCGVKAFAGALGRLQARFHWASRLANIVSCGAMLGAAMFDPISADEQHRYCEMAGRLTIPLGLAILLLFALLAGPLRTDLAAWVPLYITTVSLLTVSLSPILGRQTLGPTPLDDSAANDLEFAIPTENDDSDEEEPSQHEDLRSPAMARWEQESAARYHLLGPHHPALVAQPARTSTTLSLSSTPGQPRSSWGSHVLRFWLDPLALSSGQPRRFDLDRPSLDGLLDLDGMPNNGSNAATNRGGQ